MELQIIPAAASDARDIGLITNIAFIDDALNKAITRQDTATEAERREFTEWRIRTVSKQLKQANLHWFKALDTMTNRITGFGVVVEPGIDEQSSQDEINLPTCFDLQLAGTVEQTMEAVKEELIGKDSSTLCMSIPRRGPLEQPEVLTTIRRGYLSSTSRFPEARHSKENTRRDHDFGETKTTGYIPRIEPSWDTTLRESWIQKAQGFRCAERRILVYLDAFSNMTPSLRF